MAATSRPGDKLVTGCNWPKGDIVKSVLILIACMILGFVYEITLGYSYSLSGQLAVATQAVVHLMNIPTMIWFATWAILVFAPVAALAAYVLLRLQPRPLALGVVLFLVPALVIRLFGYSIWRQFDYDASYFVGNYAELFAVFVLPLIFLWVWNHRGRRVAAEKAFTGCYWPSPAVR